MKQCLYDLPFYQFEEWMANQGQKSFRAAQVFEWAYKKNADSFEAMTNLSKELRTLLDGSFYLGPLQHKAISGDEEATKLLVKLPLDGSVECVRVDMGHSFTACLSSQLGCAVRCAFCATGQMGCDRGLTPGEIIAQYITIRAMGEQVSNVVFMGMGEPFHNYANVVAAIRLLVDKRAFGMSPSRITVSTAGIAPMICKYAEERIPTELAISLNASNDALRERLMPGVSEWPIAQVAAAAKFYTEATGGQPVTFAYVLIEDVNDHLDHARELAQLLRRQPHHLNVIPLNPVGHTDLKRPSKQRTNAFILHCRQSGLNVSLRRSKGVDVDAACGQLSTRVDRKS